MPSLTANHIELESVDQVPDTHSWTATDDHPVSSDPLPLIDLAGPGAAAGLAAASRSVGAFQVTGHGVPPAVLARLESQLVRLFALPLERKLEAARTAEDVTGYGNVPIADFFAKQMWSEGFTIAGSPLKHALKLWPDDPMQFCDAVEAYDREMKGLAMRLMRALLTSLGLDDGDIGRTGVVVDATALAGAIRVNSYPPCPDPDRAMGLGAHTDSSLITILYQNGTSGLQALLPGPARWATFPVVPGSLIVILGDLFQILTDGRFKSAYHRAVVNRSERRLSAAYFCGPAAAKAAAAERLVDPARGPVYRAVTWPEYRKIKERLFQQALDSLKM